jgi:MFS transporter, DHA1 family, multidrug resistance protein
MMAAMSSRLHVANLMAQLAYGLVTMTICLPSMQEWGALFGAGPSQVQLTFSGFVLTYGALQLVYGPLSDRQGRRRLLLIGLALAGTASLAAVFATSIEALIAARVVQGAGCAAGMVLGRAAVQDLFTGPERTRVMAYVGMAMGLCPPLSTVIGGQLHARFGWQANFVLLAVLAVLLMVAAWHGMPAQRTAAAAGTHWLRAMGVSYARLMREPAFVLNVMVLSLTVGAFYAYLGGAPLVLGSYGIGPATVGFYIMVPPLSYIVGNYLTSRLVRRIGEGPVKAAGQAATIAGIVLMIGLALLGWRSGLSFTLPLVLAGAVGHRPRPAGAAHAGGHDRLDPGARGRRCGRRRRHAADRRRVRRLCRGLGAARRAGGARPADARVHAVRRCGAGLHSRTGDTRHANSGVKHRGRSSGLGR